MLKMANTMVTLNEYVDFSLFSIVYVHELML